MVFAGGRADTDSSEICTRRQQKSWLINQLILLWGNKRMRIMGLDFGSKTVGVAVSDTLGWTAQGVETIVRKNEDKLRQTCARIEALIAEYEVELLVLGYPKNMDGTIGERARKTEVFRDMLARRTGLPVVLWDERLTTVEAEQILIESGVRRENRKTYIDKIAAMLILQDYLDAKQHESRQKADRAEQNVDKAADVDETAITAAKNQKECQESEANIK